MTRAGQQSVCWRKTRPVVSSPDIHRHSLIDCGKLSLRIVPPVFPIVILTIITHSVKFATGPVLLVTVIVKGSHCIQYTVMFFYLWMTGWNCAAAGLPVKPLTSFISSVIHIKLRGKYDIAEFDLGNRIMFGQWKKKFVLNLWRASLSGSTDANSNAKKNLYSWKTERQRRQG